MEEIRKKIEVLAESLEDQFGVKVYDVEMVGNARKPFVRVYIDKEEGVSLDECANFSRSLSALIDVEDPIPTAFVLEVSSPGLDRQLKKLKHYEQSKGKLARLVLRKAPALGQNVVTGRIVNIEGEKIILRTADEEDMSVSFENISRARLEIEPK